MVDAADSKSAVREDVRVRVSSPVFDCLRMLVFKSKKARLRVLVSGLFDFAHVDSRSRRVGRLADVLSGRAGLTPNVRKEILEAKQGGFDEMPG